MDWMKQMKKLTRDQKIRLSKEGKEGKDPKEYMWCERMKAFIRKDGKQEVADRPEECRK